MVTAGEAVNKPVMIREYKAPASVAQVTFGSSFTCTPNKHTHVRIHTSTDRRSSTKIRPAVKHVRERLAYCFT